MSDIFTVYLNIFGTTPHLISLVSALLALLVGFLLLRSRFNFFEVLIIDLLVCQIGNFTYEVYYTFFSNLLLLCLFDAIMLFGLLNVTCSLNKKRRFIQPSGWTLVSTAIFLIHCYALYSTGWFSAAQMWRLGTGPDPHNLLWAVTKLFAFVVPITILQRQRLEVRLNDK